MTEKLTSYEKKWIAKRLRIYKIKYAEIYDEVYDHLLSACETKRQSGDKRPVLSLFQETMDQDLGSHRGLEQMTVARAEELNTVLRRKFRKGFGAYLAGGRLWWALAVWAGISLLLIQTQLSPRYAMIGVLAMSLFPLLYMAIFGTRNNYLRGIRSRRKTSLVNHLMFGLLALPLMFMNGVVSLLSSADFFRGSESMYDSLRVLLHRMGSVGIGLVWTVMLIYCKVVFDILHTTYRKLMEQVSA